MQAKVKIHRSAHPPGPQSNPLGFVLVEGKPTGSCTERVLNH